MITRIKETCLYVSDLDKTAKFYTDMLGFPIIGKVEGRHIFFRAGESVLLCFIAEATAKDEILPPHHGTGSLHIAFEVDPLEYEQWKQDLMEKGIEILHEQEWRPDVLSFYFHDPDGHVLEIVPKGMWDGNLSI